MAVPAVHAKVDVGLLPLIRAVRVAEETVRGHVMGQHHPPLVSSQDGVPGGGVLRVSVQLCAWGKDNIS